MKCRYCGGGDTWSFHLLHRTGEEDAIEPKNTNMKVQLPKHGLFGPLSALVIK
jgi:hypothetical protein